MPHPPRPPQSPSAEAPALPRAPSPPRDLPGVRPGRLPHLRHLLLCLTPLTACGGDGSADAAPPAEVPGMEEAAPLPAEEIRALPGRIAWVAEGEGNAEVRLLRPADGGARRLTRHPAADFPAAASPDGRTLLLVRSREEDGEHRERLLLADLETDGGPVPLGPESARVRSPAWSPDGRWIVFESDRASFRDLWRIRPDGTGLERLTETEAGSFEPAVSPDGRWIAFASSRDGDAELYVAPFDGAADAEPRRLTHFHRDDVSPSWSPDGAWIAWISDREGSDRVFLVRPDGTGTRRLTADGDSATAEAAPAWSPDGTRVALVVRPREGEPEARVVDVASGEARTVFRGPGVGAPAWSPTGEHLVLSAGAGDDADLWLVRADGSGRARLVDAPGADWLPRWLPDPVG